MLSIKKLFKIDKHNCVKEKETQLPQEHKRRCSEHGMKHRLPVRLCFPRPGRRGALWLRDLSYSPGDPDLNKLPLLSFHSAASVNLRTPHIVILSYRISTCFSVLLQPQSERERESSLMCRSTVVSKAPKIQVTCSI